MSISPPFPVAAQVGPDSRHVVADASFEQRLIEAIRPISEHFLAAGIHHLIDTGLYDRLESCPEGAAIPELAAHHTMDVHRLRGFLLYLANEGIVQIEDDRVRLTAKGGRYGEFRAWYTMLIGGYMSTLGQMGTALALGAPTCSRDGRYVGLGSCGISRYDGMPITRHLIARAAIQCQEVLDLGCGNGLYLVEFCKEMPGVRAWGAEPDAGGYAEAVRLIGASGVEDRIRLVHASASEFLCCPPPECDPDLIVFGFVLHEVLAQEGEDAVIALLRGVVDRFPRINVVVIEVANQIDNAAIMRHGLATNFWNPYFLVHYFTRQQLERRMFWDALFAKAGLRTIALVTTDPHVDSTGLELGYLLRGPAAEGG
jgi:2-ketoarginine methyltransferase